MKDRTFAGILLGSLLPAAIVFGVVPPSLIARLPLIGNVQHVDNTFSCVLILHLLVIAGFGLRSLWDGAKEDRWVGDSMLAAFLLALLAAGFLGYSQAAHRSGRSLLHAGETMEFSGFFLAYSAALGVSVLSMPWIVRSLRTRPSVGTFVAAALCLFILHFRHSTWTATKFDHYVMNPQSRSDLAAPSRARCTAVNDGTVSGSSRFGVASAGVLLSAVSGDLAIAAVVFPHDHFCLRAGTAMASPSVEPPQTIRTIREMSVLPLKTRDRVPKQA